MPPNGGSTCLLSLWLSTSSGKVNILSIYTPTLCSAQERKDKVYEEPNVAICKIPKSESVTSMSEDLIATLDQAALNILGSAGWTTMDNDIYHKLCITNIFFQTRYLHKVSRWHPRSGHCPPKVALQSFWGLWPLLMMGWKEQWSLMGQPQSPSKAEWNRAVCLPQHSSGSSSP